MTDKVLRDDHTSWTTEADGTTGMAWLSWYFHKIFLVGESSTEISCPSALAVGA